MSSGPALPPDLAGLSAGFPAPSPEVWRAQVDKALKGGSFDRLISRTLDGLAIQPLYPRATDGRPPLARAQAQGWRALTRIDHAEPDAANEQARVDLEGGAQGLHVVMAGSLGACGFGLPEGAGALEAALAGVDLALADVDLDLGADGALALRLAALAEKQGLAPERAAISFGLRAQDPQLAARATALAQRGFRGPFAAADARAVHAAGGSPAQELAFALAEGVAILRALEAAGMSVEEARDALVFRMACDADFFVSLSKLRALRLLWARVEEGCGLAPAPARIHAQTGWRMMTRRDPWVNVLRTTTAAFAAAAGGADAISVLPFTQALGLPDAFARRLARNAQLVLAEEAHAARVADPAAGAGGFEALTDALCETAWGLFQTCERAGSLKGAAQTVSAEVAKTRATLRKDAARRKEAITGASIYPDLAEAPQSVLAPLPRDWRGDDAAFPAMRLAEDFERLRDQSDEALRTRGARPRVFLLALGSLVAASARMDFARGVFEAGGFETHASEDLGAFAASGATLACLCGTDEAYGAQGEAAAQALKAAGARRLWLAGRGGDAEAGLRAAGVDAFVFAGADIIAALEEAWVAA
jgi:methylmalonyl-CoA mutase